MVYLFIVRTGLALSGPHGRGRLIDAIVTLKFISFHIFVMQKRISSKMQSVFPCTDTNVVKICVKIHSVVFT